MILFRQRGIRIAEAWFDLPPPSGGADLVCYVQRPGPIPGGRNHEKHTLLIDLSQEEDALFAAVNPDTRTKIRRARDKDGIRCEAVPVEAASLADFTAFYGRFASGKGLHAPAPGYLEAVARDGGLDLSRACDPLTGEVLVWHAHLVACGRARLLLSASLFRESEDAQRRNLIGRANRYLHWCDLLRFKAALVGTYDWGGWYAGATDEAKLQINRFKKDFGGSVAREWSSDVGVTLRGRLALLLRRLRGRSE